MNEPMKRRQWPEGVGVFVDGMGGERFVLKFMI